MLILPMQKDSPDIVCEVDGKEILRVRIIVKKTNRDGGKIRTTKRIGFIAGQEVRIRRDYPEKNGNV